MLNALTETLQGIQSKAEKLPELIESGNIEFAVPISKSLDEELTAFAKKWLEDIERLKKEGNDIYGLNDSDTNEN